VKISLDPADLRPIVAAVVAETLAAVRGSDSALEGGRLAFTESEAAAALGCRAHVLRDARLRGEIVATRIGGRIGYERGELMAYLARNRGAGR
jgi:hypothetical protein